MYKQTHANFTKNDTSTRQHKSSYNNSAAKRKSENSNKNQQQL